MTLDPADFVAKIKEAEKYVDQGYSLLYSLSMAGISFHSGNRHKIYALQEYKDLKEKFNKMKGPIVYRFM